MTANRQKILVFSDDWGRHPSSCQHLVTRLLQRYAVLWVNTIGMRAPQLNALTLLRGVEKVRQWTRKKPSDSAPLPDHLEVLNPKMWPWMRSKFDRAFNRRLLARQLTPHLQSCDPPAVAITTVPVVADLVGVLPVQSWLYYCVDDFSAWPGLDQAALGRLERDLVSVSIRAAISENQQERLAGMGASSHLLTHGVDVDFWASASADSPLPAEGAREPFHRILGTERQTPGYRVLRQLSANLLRGTILMVGPENEPDPVLETLPRVRCVDALPFEDGRWAPGPLF